MPTLNFSNIIPARLAAWQESFISIPAFSYLDASVWQGNSKVITQFNYSSTKNFTIRELPTKPVNPTFCPVIRYRVGNTSYRYKLWWDVGEGINEPPYRGELIKKNFVIEIWDVNGQTSLVNEEAIEIPLSIRRIPDTILADILNPYQEASSSEVSQQQQTSIIPTSPATTGLQFWFKADTGVTDAGGGVCSAWADQSGNGRTLVQGTGAQRPVIVTGPIGELTSTTLIALDAVNHNMSWSGSAFNLAAIFLVCTQDNWVLNRRLFNTSGTINILQNAISPQIRFLYGASSVNVSSNIGNTGQVLLMFVDDTNFIAATDLLYGISDEFYASTARTPGGIGEVLQGITSFTLGDNGVAASINVAEIIGYSSLTAATELQTLQYLAGRYRPGSLAIPLTFNSGIQGLDND